jgi:hypothetical protein
VEKRRVRVEKKSEGGKKRVRAEKRAQCLFS